MDIYEQLSKMKPFIKQRNWGGLEHAFRSVCIELAGSQQANRIAALDFSSYERALAAGLADASYRIGNSKAVALYFEYDLENRWAGHFFLCQEYHPESADYEDWACDWLDEIDGPSFPEAASLYAENHFDRTPMAVGSTLYLVSRTVAAFGRSTDGIPINRQAICIGFHDQTPITRIREP